MSATQVVNNLGGTGPDFGEACNCLKFANAGTYLSQSIDLIVTLSSGAGYNPPPHAGRNAMAAGQVRLSVLQSEYTDIEFHFECASPHASPHTPLVECGLSAASAPLATSARALAHASSASGERRD